MLPRFWIRLSIAGALMLSGVVLAGARSKVALQNGGLHRTISEPRQLCKGTPVPSLRGTINLVSRNGLVFANLVLGSLTFGARTAAQLNRLGHDTTAVAVIGSVESGSVLFMVAALLPHALLEMGAFLGAGATGLGLTVLIVRSLKHWEWPPREDLFQISRELRNAFLLLILAALVEECVTPIAMSWSLGC